MTQQRYYYAYRENAFARPLVDGVHRTVIEAAIATGCDAARSDAKYFAIARVWTSGSFGILAYPLFIDI